MGNSHLANSLCCRTRAKAKAFQAPTSAPKEYMPSVGKESTRLVAIMKRYTKLINACAREQQWEQAAELMRDMRAQGVRPDVICYTAAINACAKGRQVKKAMQLLEEMRLDGLKPDLISYNALVGACARSGHCKLALQLVEEMRLEGVHPDVITYNTAISACANGGMSECAIQLLREMPSHGLQPDIITYSATIDACSKDVSRSDHCKLALGLLEEMRENGLKPNVICYNAAMCACSKAMLPEGALALMRQMEERGVSPTHVSYSTVIAAFTTCGKCKDAIPLLREMIGLIKEHASCVRAFNSIVTACVQSGQSDLCLDLVLDMRKDGLLQEYADFGAIIATLSPQTKACPKAGLAGKAPGPGLEERIGDAKSGVTSAPRRRDKPGTDSGQCMHWPEGGARSGSSFKDAGRDWGSERRGGWNQGSSHHQGNSWREGDSWHAYGKKEDDWVPTSTRAASYRVNAA